MATTSIQYDQMVTDIATSGVKATAQDQGILRVARFDLEFSASAAGTTLNLCRLPAGARVIAVLLGFEGTASLTLDVGDASDTDRLVAAADLGTDSPTTGGVIKMFGRVDTVAFGTAPQSSTPAVGIGYTYTAETTITGTTGGATATAGEVLRGCILYTLP